MVLILFLRSLLFSLYFYISVIVFTVFFVVISPFIGLKRRYGLTNRYISTLLIVLKFLCRIDWEVRGDILGKKPIVIAITIGFLPKISPLTSQSIRHRNFKTINSVDIYRFVKPYLLFSPINGEITTKNTVNTITEM